MNPQKIFQFAVLRYIHDLTTGEFLNVGLALYSKPDNYLRVKLLPKYSRITNTFPGADGEFYRRYINHLQFKFNGLSQQIENAQASLFGDWPDHIEKLLHQVLPVDDSSVQFGPVQGGVSEDLKVVFDDLYSQLVERYIAEDEKRYRSDDEVWFTYSRIFRAHHILNLLKPKIIQTKRDEFEFDHAWKNGKWNLLQPLSFDLMHPTTIRRKAKTWLGTVIELEHNTEWARLYFLLGKPKDDQAKLAKAYGDAKDIIHDNLGDKRITIIEEDAADDFVKFIKPQIEDDLGITSNSANS